MITVSLEMTSTDDELSRLFSDACRKMVGKAITKAIPEIKTKISQFIEIAIKSSPEYEAMINGKLKAELGFINGHSMVDPIIKAVSENVVIDFDSVSTLTVRFIQEDHADILGLPTASYMSNEYEINWLEWLLTRGYDIIIADYKIKYGITDRSRSKMAIMIAGGVWQVPSEYAGFIGYNFLTRAFDNSEHIVHSIIKDAILKRI